MIALLLFFIFLFGVVAIATDSPFIVTSLCIIFALTLAGVDVTTPDTFISTINSIPIWYWIVGFLIQMIIGGGYSLFAWKEHLRKEKKKQSNSWKELFESKGILPDWANPTYNKSLFYCWIIGWEFDLVWKLIKDPVRFVYTYLYKSYEKIARNLLK